MFKPLNNKKLKIITIIKTQLNIRFIAFCMILYRKEMRPLNNSNLRIILQINRLFQNMKFLGYQNIYKKQKTCAIHL